VAEGLLSRAQISSFVIVIHPKALQAVGGGAAYRQHLYVLSAVSLCALYLLFDDAMLIVLIALMREVRVCTCSFLNLEQHPNITQTELQRDVTLHRKQLLLDSCYKNTRYSHHEGIKPFYPTCAIR
jgi:hypothetical protein